MLSQVLVGVFFLILVVVLVGFVWAIGRSVIAERRLRGRESRLAQPCLREVESYWNVRLPQVLEDFYCSGAAQRGECYLALPTSDREQEPTRWFVSNFIPLTVRDLKDWLRFGHIPGIPIAYDGDHQRFYYLPFAALREDRPCPVMYRSLAGRWPWTDQQVAACVEDFVQFQVVEPEETDANDDKR